MNVNKYHKQFLESFTGENILPLFARYKGSAKEITESMALLEAGRKYLRDDYDMALKDSVVIVIGDGASPRTGACFAYYTHAEVISIDPNFNMDHWSEFVDKQTKMGYPPQRLQVIKERFEDVHIDCLNKDTLVIWPHSHAPMSLNQLSNYKSRVDIAMPCCMKIPPAWMSIPHIFYTDLEVLSPKNEIHIWKG